MVIGVHRRVIAIDGPAGAGKSTIAKALASRLKMKYLDTGAMYRAVTFEAMLRELDLDDQGAITLMAQECDLHVGLDRVIINGHDATLAIRGPEVTGNVSKVAANSGVRTEMRIRQQEWATSHGGGVIEGRDIATVVFPDAVLKVFLTASPEVRALRRVDQSGGNVTEIAAAIAQRDLTDSTRADSPLASSSDSVVIDTSDRAIEDVVDEIEKLFMERNI
ncbi:cytidylate kinase [Actinomycetes bacterium]|nr:cytidylate kinase [Actinomycetes bacterium]